MSAHDRLKLTEAEYEVWLRQRMKVGMDRLNERYADWLPDGVRFEWVPLDAPELTRAHGVATTMTRERPHTLNQPQEDK